MPTRPPTPATSGRRAMRSVPLDGEPRASSRVLRFFSGALTFFLLVLVIVGGSTFVVTRNFDVPGPLTSTTVVVIPKGEGTYDIAARLEGKGIITDRRLFVAQYWAARSFGGLAADKTIKAGEYEVKAAASVRDVLDTLIEGRAILHKVTIPEGLTSLQIVERLRADTGLSGEITEVPAEGTLLPDTYKVGRGMARQEVIDRMRADQKRVAAQLWARRQPDLPVKTLEQALILASIVEKETSRADERTKVAAVFVNRLRKPMRLQSDPTIIYGLVAGQGPLGRAITRADIDSKTSYNTYQIDGLPPTPICNPGRSAIEATLNPAKTQDLFFVADGTGGHAFTTNLKDHNIAVGNWRRIEREKAARLQPGAPAAPADKQEAATPPLEPTAASVPALAARPPQVFKPAPTPPKAKVPTEPATTAAQKKP